MLGHIWLIANWASCRSWFCLWSYSWLTNLWNHQYDYRSNWTSFSPITITNMEGRLHDDDGNKNVTNLHIWQWKTILFCTLCTCIFHFWTSRRSSRSFHDVQWPVLQLRGRCEYRWFSRYVIAAMLVDENKTSLISSFCSSTSNCTLQHCHLCL